MTKSTVSFIAQKKHPVLVNVSHVYNPFVRSGTWNLRTMHQQILINLRSYLTVYDVVCSVFCVQMMLCAALKLLTFMTPQLEWVLLSVTTQMYSLFRETSSVLYNQCPIILSPFPF